MFDSNLIRKLEELEKAFSNESGGLVWEMRAEMWALYQQSAKFRRCLHRLGIFPRPLIEGELDGRSRTS